MEFFCNFAVIFPTILMNHVSFSKYVELVLFPFAPNEESGGENDYSPQKEYLMIHFLLLESSFKAEIENAKIIASPGTKKDHAKGPQEDDLA